jgi:colicin import membrane protein
MDEPVNFYLKIFSALAMPAILAVLGPAQSAWAQEPPAAADQVKLFEQYPPGSIHAVATANAALDAAARERARIDLQLIRQQRVCYRKFFVSSCLQNVKDAHRAESKKIKNIEIESNTYLRQARADDRDAALAEQREKELADAPRRAEEQKQNALENARKIQESASRTAEADARAKAATPTPDQRIAEHDKKMQQIRAQQEADAKMHDANVAAYEKKVKAAEERQKEVAANKAEKAAKEAAERAAGQK